MKSFVFSFLPFLILMHSALVSEAQFNRYGGKKRTEKMSSFIKPLNNTGWFFGVGATTTPKLNFIEFEPTLTTSAFQPEILTAINLEQQAQFGVYLEAGRYKLLRTKKLISYIDYGASYKQLRSGQSYDLVRENLSIFDTTSYNQTYQSHSVGGQFNANNVLAINKNAFFQNSLGVNIEYVFAQKLESEDATGFRETYQNEPSRLRAQIHYKFGIGMRISQMWYAVPSVEIPLLNVWQWEGGRSTFGAFHSRYRPIIFSIRFAWLTKPDCPKVWDNDDATQNGGGL